MSSVPLPARKVAGPVVRSRRPPSPGSTRFAAPDPSGPGAAKLLDNLRRLGAPAEVTAAGARFRRRLR